MRENTVLTVQERAAVTPSIEFAPPTIAPAVQALTPKHPNRATQDQALRDEIDEALYRMTDAELTLVAHYCQRIESERRVVA